MRIAGGEARLRRGPEGPSENRPAFQRGVWLDLTKSPAGTTEARCLSRPSGTCSPWGPSPPLKRWAILRHPSGMLLFKN